MNFKESVKLFFEFDCDLLLYELFSDDARYKIVISDKVRSEIANEELTWQEVENSLLVMPDYIFLDMENCNELFLYVCAEINVRLILSLEAYTLTIHNAKRAHNLQIL